MWKTSFGRVRTAKPPHMIQIEHDSAGFRAIVAHRQPDFIQALQLCGVIDRLRGNESCLMTLKCKANCYCWNDMVLLRRPRNFLRHLSLYIIEYKGIASVWALADAEKGSWCCGPYTTSASAELGAALAKCEALHVLECLPFIYLASIGLEWVKRKCIWNCLLRVRV